jgi:hypothetical protein
MLYQLGGLQTNPLLEITKEISANNLRRTFISPDGDDGVIPILMIPANTQ